MHKSIFYAILVVVSCIQDFKIADLLMPHKHILQFRQFVIKWLSSVICHAVDFFNIMLVISYN